MKLAAAAARSGVAVQTETEKRRRLSAAGLQGRIESHPNPRPVELTGMAGTRAVEEGREVAVLCRRGGLGRLQ
jgi:hypothetical protein